VTQSAAGTAPDWLDPIQTVVATAKAEQLSRILPPPEGGRLAAVLMLFAESSTGVDILLIQRAATLSSHGGQVAFPGGVIDPEDDGAIAAALREAQEETGLDPSGVHVVGTLPDLFVPPSNFVVTPVVGWWFAPSPVDVVDPGEVHRVERIPLSELLAPENRFTVRHPSGFTGPGFEVRGMFVWGFTAGLLSRVLALCGWEQAWDEGDVRPVPEVAA
jgi:8-oxo-dGTP pyrophosphatase MutT (NUDIX family)